MLFFKDYLEPSSDLYTPTNMKVKRFVFIALLFIANSCHVSGSKNRSDAHFREYNFSLNPVVGSGYQYTISKETEIKVKVNDQKVDNKNRVNAVLSLVFAKDSVGNTVVTIQYNNIHIYKNSNGTQTELDADNGANPFNPVEKMLHALRTIKITAVVDATRNIQSISGYEGIESEIMNEASSQDRKTEQLIKQRLDQLIRKDLIGSSINQLFKLSFPDNLQVGDQWQDTSFHSDDLDLKATTIYTLESVDNNIATLKCDGNISGKNSKMNFMTTVVVANLQGREKGTYKVNIQTGMLLDDAISIRLGGTISVLDRKIPISIEKKITVHGDKIK